MKKGFWMEKDSTQARDGEQNTTLIEPKRSYQWFVDSSEPGQYPNKKRELQNSDEKPSCSEMLYASINPWKNTSSFLSVPTQFREDAPIVTETCIGYPGISKLIVPPVKDCDYSSNDETNFAPMGLVSHAYNNTEVAQNSISVPSIISFGAFPEEQDIIPVGTSLVGYDHLYRPASATSDTDREREPDAPNTILNSGHLANPKMDSVTKHKPDCKPTTRKEAPNSFPSNVRSLISTGMLDGVPVKYISLAREELRGFIKGSGYLCGCQLCNFSKVLNAYEFERHAGCKTKHPNNHIYFENGKTIYQIVQELRNTPASLLFDTIQTVFGAPINQKSFRIWKESFQAATRELQRIYGKEGLNL